MLERPPKNDHCCCEEKPHGHRVEKGGYALFHVGSDSGGYSLKRYPLDTRKDSRSFDSQHLQQAQGLVIRTEKDNRILIELDEKNAGDGKTSRKVARMTRAARRR